MSSQGTCAMRPAENLDPSCRPYSPCPESGSGDLSQKTYNKEEKLRPPLPSDSGWAPQFSSDRPLCSHQTPWTREAADHQRTPQGQQDMKPVPTTSHLSHRAQSPASGFFFRKWSEQALSHSVVGMIRAHPTHREHTTKASFTSNGDE